MKYKIYQIEEIYSGYGRQLSIKLKDPQLFELSDTIEEAELQIKNNGRCNIEYTIMPYIYKTKFDGDE